MARKMMTKEVTTTTVQVAKMEMENGLPKAVTLPEEEILGNVSLEYAQRAMNKKHGQGTTVFGVQADTIVYELSVEEFLKHASVKEDTTEQQTAELPEQA